MASAFFTTELLGMIGLHQPLNISSLQNTLAPMRKAGTEVGGIFATHTMSKTFIESFYLTQEKGGTRLEKEMSKIYEQATQGRKKKYKWPMSVEKHLMYL